MMINWGNIKTSVFEILDLNKDLQNKMQDVLKGRNNAGILSTGPQYLLEDNVLTEAEVGALNNALLSIGLKCIDKPFANGEGTHKRWVPCYDKISFKDLEKLLRPYVINFDRDVILFEPYNVEQSRKDFLELQKKLLRKYFLDMEDQDHINVEVYYGIDESRGEGPNHLNDQGTVFLVGPEIAEEEE